MHYYYYTIYFVFTLVFHYADVTLCMTLGARILILMALCLHDELSGHENTDYKRIEVASGDESQDKLNKSNGGQT